MTHTEYLEMMKTPEGKRELYSINCKNIINLYHKNKIDNIEAARRIYETGLVLGIHEFPKESEMLKYIKKLKKNKRR